jgi:hypothetical protein
MSITVILVARALIHTVISFSSLKSSSELLMTLSDDDSNIVYWPSFECRSYIASIEIQNTSRILSN